MNENKIKFDIKIQNHEYFYMIVSQIIIYFFLIFIRRKYLWTLFTFINFLDVRSKLTFKIFCHYFLEINLI